MFKPEESAVAAAPTDGVAGNGRLTAALGALLLVLLAAEGATIPFIGQLREEHILIGMLLLGPVAAKLASTGYRFARYYLGSPAYVSKGPPQLTLRVLAPGVVFTTIALFGTGVALLVVGPNNELSFLHKVSFIAWVALMTIHVLGHVLELPEPLFAEWGRRGPRLSGMGLRLTAIAAALAIGVGLVAISFSAAGSWG